MKHLDTQAPIVKNKKGRKNSQDITAKSIVRLFNVRVKNIKLKQEAIPAFVRKFQDVPSSLEFKPLHSQFTIIPTNWDSFCSKIIRPCYTMAISPLNFFNHQM